MTVSATAVQDRTVDQIIGMAMVTAGVLNPAHLSNPPAAELDVGRTWLFMRLQSMTSSGVILRARERVTTALTTGVAYVDAAADTLSVEKGVILRDSVGQDRALNLLNLDEFQAISDKALPGAPTGVFVEQQTAGGWRIHIWPVPDGTEALTLGYPRTRRLRDVEPGNVTLDLDPKHYLHIMQWLAKMFAGSKGRIAREQSLAAEAGLERTFAEEDETTRGDSHFIAPRLDIFG